MSYILDALKKAESERKLGSIPDMHAQPLTARSTDGSPAWRGPLAWIVLATVLLVAAAIMWRTQLRPDRDSNPITRLPQQAFSAEAKQDTPDDTGLSSSVAPEPALPPIAQTPAGDSADIAPETAAPIERSDPPKTKATAKPVKKRKTEPAAKPATAAAPVKPLETERPGPAPAAMDASAPRVPRFHELPGNIQREIPPLTVGGYIYSSVPSERSVLINNRLLREGGEITPGLVLEKMLPKEAILNYNGYRYRIPY